MDIDDIERVHPSAQIAQPAFQVEELLLRFPKRLPETLDLFVDQVGIAQFIKGNLCIEPIEKISLADDDPRRDPDSFNDKRFFQIIVNHVIPCYRRSVNDYEGRALCHVSPNFSAISPVKAAIASFASTPLAEIVNRLPCGQKSVSIPRMLRPLTATPSFSKKISAWKRLAVSTSLAATLACIPRRFVISNVLISTISNGKRHAQECRSIEDHQR